MPPWRTRCSGQLELNVMMPLMAWEVLFSIDLLANYLPCSRSAV